MAKPRILYLAGVAACLILYMAYREWLAWLLLLAVLWLPVFSFAVTLPAIALLQLRLDTPGSICLGESCTLSAHPRCTFPCPPVKYRFSLQEQVTGQKISLLPGIQWTPEHCGIWNIQLQRSFVYDYLGLFRLPVGRKLTATLSVEPVPVFAEIPDIRHSLSPRKWNPKPGGGFAENHDLRLYRPGDSLHHIHWKMAAKTGKLIYREPMEPAGEIPVLLLRLPDPGQQRDEVLGKLLWLSRYLLSHQRSHALQCLTGQGLYRCTISDQATLADAVHALLSRSAPAANTVLPEIHRTQCFRIGGAPDET